MLERFKIEFKWASIFTAISIIWVYVEKYLGLHSEHIEFHSIVGLIIIIPFALSIYLCLKEKKREYYKGNMTWQKAFLSGALLSLLIAGLSIGTTYVMTQYVSPDFFEVAIEKSVAQGTDRELMEQFFNLNAYISQGIMFYLAFGVMISALFALVIRSKAKA
jgi:cytochrome b561